ncbi:MAG: CpXC domain-containing protein [Kofleriaceae bacterium]
MPSITGTIQVECPACDRPHEAKLVQSVNTRTAPADKQKLLAGELNVVVCPCGAHTQLESTIVFHDPDSGFLCQVCPGGEQALISAAELMRAVGAVGSRRRLVPSLNALVEKVKLVDAGLDDRAIEMTKVLLLAAMAEPDLDRVLLFDRVEDGVIHWLRFDGGDELVATASPLASYERLAARAGTDSELRVDRAWAVEAVRAMIADAN